MERQQSEITQQKTKTEFSEKKFRVLVVDDDFIQLLYLAKFLSALGIFVDTAKNGLLAVEKFGQCNYDIIIMDGQMPEMDGFRATKEIREVEKIKQSRTPIIAVSGYAHNHTEEYFFEAGVDEFLTKPIDEGKLIRLIKKHLPDKHPEL